jgi:cytoskeletal protein CcmA (bactofilin family)
MWKASPEEKKSTNPQPPLQPAAAPAVPPATTQSVISPPKETAKISEPPRADVGHIGKSVVIRGELTGNEDLYLDGEVEGTINLSDHKLVIGPNGKIKASITAREVVLHGRVEGNVSVTERAELKRSCTLIGDVSTPRIVIEDGAFFKGTIDIPKEAKPEQRRPAVGVSVSSGGTNAGSSPAISLGGQGSFLESK